MNKDTSISLVEIIENNAEKINNPLIHDHVMIILESDQNGLPNGKVIKVKGNPFGLLGMIDLIVEELGTIREGIVKKFNQASNMAQNLKTASSSHRERLRELEAAARKASEQGDNEALDQIRLELINLLKDMKNSSSDEQNDDNDNEAFGSDEFRIDDFKGGF